MINGKWLDPGVYSVVLAIGISHLKPVRPGALSMCVFALSVVVWEKRAVTEALGKRAGRVQMLSWAMTFSQRKKYPQSQA